jgi:hypothetical protein
MYNNTTAINKHSLSLLYKNILSVCRNTAAFLARDESPDPAVQQVRERITYMLECMKEANLINATPDALLTVPDMRTPLHSLPVETVHYQREAMHSMQQHLCNHVPGLETLPRIRVALDNIDEHRHRDLHAYEGFLIPSRGGIYSMLQFINLLQHKSLAEYYGNNTHGGNPHWHEGNIFSKPVVVHREGGFWAPLLNLLSIDEASLAEQWNIHFADSLEECAHKMTEGWQRYRASPIYNAAIPEGDAPQWHEKKLFILFSRTAEKRRDIQQAIEGREEFSHITITDIGEIEALMAAASLTDDQGHPIRFAFQSPLETSLSYSGNAEEKLSAAFDAMKQIGITHDGNGNQSEAGRKATAYLLEHFGVSYENVLVMVDDAGLWLDSPDAAAQMTFPSLADLNADMLLQSADSMPLEDLYHHMHNAEEQGLLQKRLEAFFGEPFSETMLNDWMLHAIWRMTQKLNLPFPGVELAYAKDAAGGFGPLMKRLQEGAANAGIDGHATMTSNYTQMACSIDALRGAVDITRLLAVHDARNYTLTPQGFNGCGYAPATALEHASTWHFAIPEGEDRTVSQLTAEEAAQHNQRQSCFLTLLEQLHSLSQANTQQADIDRASNYNDHTADSEHHYVA